MIDKEDAESSWNSLVRNSPMITYKFAFKPKAIWSQMWEMPWKWLKSYMIFPNQHQQQKTSPETLQAVPNSDWQENTRSMQYLQ